MAYGTVNADTITTSSGAILGAGNASAMKNRIINGAMVISQRGASAVTNPNQYILDRFYSSSLTATSCCSSSSSPSSIKSAMLSLL